MLLISCYCAHISSFYGDFLLIHSLMHGPSLRSVGLHLAAPLLCIYKPLLATARVWEGSVCEGGGSRRRREGWGVGGGGIDFWWIEGVLFLLYMWQKTPWHIDLRGEHSLLNVPCKKTRQWKSLTGDSLDDIWYPCVPNVNNCFHLSAISPQDFILIFCYKPQSLRMYNFVLSNIFE